MKLVIPCAGESSRMAYVPKHLITINGRPLITHVIETWKDKVDSFVFVLKRAQTHMWEYLPQNSAVVFQDEPLGLANAILQARECVSGPFTVALGDCLHRGTFIPTAARMGFGAWSTNDLKEVNKSYLIREEKTGLHLLEKPNLQPTTAGPFLCGMGTYFLDERVFNYIENYKGVKGGGDLTFILQTMIDNREPLQPIPFHGSYVNIGSPEDIAKAEEILRDKV